jgi:predicted secreted protein
MTAVFGKGTLLEKDTTGAGNWVTVAQCRTISGPSYEGEEIDVTSHDSAGGFREFIRGLIDPGDMTADIIFDPNDQTHTGASGLIEDLKSGDIRPWRLQWTSAAPPQELIFSAFVRSFPITNPVDAELSASLTLRITGEIIFQAV